MATVNTTLTSEGLVVSADVMAQFDLHPGAQVQVTIEPKQMRPVHPDALHLLEELKGMFAGTPSLEDELLKDRREEHRNFKW